LLLFFIGVYSAVISSTYFLLPLYLQGNLHFSGGQIGLLYAVLNLNAILVAFPVGISGDRYPARVLTQLGLAGTASAFGEWPQPGASGPSWPFSGALA
jgi:MFS family permease